MMEVFEQVVVEGACKIVDATMEGGRNLICFQMVVVVYNFLVVMGVWILVAAAAAA